MSPKVKTSSIQEILNESEALQNEFIEIQAMMQTERIKNLRQWNVQRKLLTKTLNYIDQLWRNDARVKAKLRKQENWEANFKCDGLPHTFRPDDIRNYILKWDHDMQSEIDSPLDLSLQRNELSILTQDDTVPDTTLVKLKATRIERGHKLVQTMKDVEYILNGIRKVVDLEKGSFTKDEKQTLRSLQSIMHKNIKKCIDVYTVKLLKNMEGEMEPTKTFVRKGQDFSPRKSLRWGDQMPELVEKLDITSLQHSFSNKDFSYHIWALRDVPQPQRTFADRFTIPLASFGGEASFPYTMAMQDLAFRSYWTPFDHYSIHCPTYTITNGLALIVDLLTALSQEWTERGRIDQEKDAYLNSKKVEFDNTIQAWTTEEQERLELQETNGRVRGSMPKERQKRIKIKREKLSFGSFQKYDSKAEYIENEDRQYEKSLKDMYPDEKTLIAGDINLRCYEILGGVFHFEFLPKPAVQANYFSKQLVNISSIPPTTKNLQTLKFYETTPTGISIPKFDDFMTGQPRKEFSLLWPSEPETPRKNFTDILKGREKMSSRKHEFAASLKPSRLSLKDALRRSEFSFGRQTQGFFEQVQSRPTIADDNLVMIEFEIKLPPNIMWWTKPSVCYWEPWEYSEAFQKLPESEKEFYRNYDVSMDMLRRRLFKPTAKHRPTEKVVPDFNMKNIPKSVDFKEICRKYIVPALPYNYQTHMDIVLDKKVEEETLRKKRIEIGLQESNGEVVYRPSMFEHEVNRTPPSPLFVPQSQTHAKVNIVRPNVSDDELDADTMNEKPASKDLDPDNESDEFRPPSILFSEFYKQITTQAETEALLSGENESDKILRLQTASDEFDLAGESWSMENRVNIRRSMGTKSQVGSEKSKDLSDQRQQLATHESQELRGSAMDEYALHPLGRWCNRNIVNQRYNEEAQTITFRSPCFGAYALAVDRYQHMPYKSWSLSVADMKHPYVTMHLTTQFISLQIQVSVQGYTLCIPPKSPIPIEPELVPMSLFDFKRMLSKVGLNIFPERDAPCYIPSITEKHPSMEYHIYNAMACFCRFFNFQQSPWNRLAHRRQVIINVQHEQQEKRMVEGRVFDVLITPNECFRTKVREACSMDLDEINLEFPQESPEQEYQPDLFFLLKAEMGESDIKETDEQMLSLMYNIAQLLWSIRPLSFSL